MTLNQKDKDEFLNTAIYAAKEASKVILRSNQKTVKTYKAKTDLVTSTDHESERAVSYTHLRAHETLRLSRMPSSA